MSNILNDYLKYYEQIYDKINQYYQPAELNKIAQSITDYKNTYLGLIPSLVQEIQSVDSLFSKLDFQPLLDVSSIITAQVPNISMSVIQAIQNTNSLVSQIASQSFLDVSSIVKQLSSLYSPEIFSDSLKLIIEKNKNQICEVAKLLLETTSILSFEDKNLSKIEILSDRSIKYGDTVLKQEEIAKELESQLEELKKKQKSLHDKFEDMKKKCWLVLLIINLLIFIPQAIETTEFYIDNAAEIKTLISNEAQYCWVVKEHAYLRETANSKSKVIYKLLYDSKLEIISEIPRWLKVKYVDEIGNEYIGWISKISVEKE